MKNSLIILSLFLVIPSFMNAQVVMSDLDINNVRATILTHGDMFWDPTSGNASYEFPKGSGKHSNFANSIWIAGYDTANVLHVSAQTYRQSGNDYWPGPLDNTGVLTLSTSNNWDKIWKVNKSEIDAFIVTSPHTILNTPAVILEWPAKGNINAKGKGGVGLTINKNMAPFVDVNTDGVYNALDGDYPKIKGEQALWWVFSDNGPTHDETNGLPLKIEVQAMAYACNSIPSLQNTTFYNFSIVNYDSNIYNNTRIGIWNDFDLGYGFDDYIGTDTIRRMGIGYNSDSSDDGPDGYGLQLTQIGTVILKSPLDAGTFKQPLGSFMYYNNSSSPMGNPIIASHYFDYLNSKWLDGKPLTNTCNGRDSGSSVNYLYPSDPSNTSGWSEKQCNNLPDDRRIIMSTGDFMLPTLDPMQFTIAVINTPIGSNNNDFSIIKDLADSAYVYENGCGSPSVVSSVQNYADESTISLYPNPAIDKITISWNNNLNDEIISGNLFNAFGQKMMTSRFPSSNSFDFNTTLLPKGIYFIQIQTSNNSIVKKFVKR